MSIHSYRKWALFLFGWPLVAVGVGMGWVLVSCLIEWRQMDHWVEIPANIFGKYVGRKPKYKYVFKNKTYTGDRVDMHGGTDNFGGIHEGTMKFLEKYLGKEKPFRCYVNPENPQESILFRKPRLEKLGLYFVLLIVCGGGGIWMLQGYFYLVIKSITVKKLVKKYPRKPWRHNPAWGEEYIKDELSFDMWSTIVCAVVLNIIFSPLLFLILELRKWNGYVLAAVVFLLLGLSLIFLAFWYIMRRCKYGRSKLKIYPMPGILGGPLTGVIYTSTPVNSETGFALTLRCLWIIRHTRSAPVRILWQKRINVGKGMAGGVNGRTAIPVLFALPYGLPRSSLSSNDEKYIINWELVVRAKTPGIDYAARFVVPVFKTTHSSKSFKLPHKLTERIIENGR